jgi:hypothetical protein
VSRVLLRTAVLGSDTLRLDVLGYHDEQVVEEESYYSIGRAPQQRENGIIARPTAGHANQPWAGHYIPGQRHTYNAAGWLVRTQYLPTPPQLAAKPVTQASADGRGTMTTTPLSDTLTTIYLRNSDGQLLRQEYRGGLYTISGQPPSPHFTAYDYLPNGLRRSRLDNHGTRYEYHYTFY